MPSIARLEANRMNALRSTGPRTPEGKAASSHNRTKFGLFSRRDAVPAHLEAVYEKFRDDHLRELAPSTHMELGHAKEIVSALWRLERIAQLEAESNIDPVQSDGQTFERARTTASRALNRAMQNLRHAQSNRFARLLTYGNDSGEDFAFSDLRHIFTAMQARPAYILKEVEMIRATDNRIEPTPVVEFLPNWSTEETNEQESESETVEPETKEGPRYETELVNGCPRAPVQPEIQEFLNRNQPDQPAESENKDFSLGTRFASGAASQAAAGTLAGVHDAHSPTEGSTGAFKDDSQPGREQNGEADTP